MMMPTIGSLGRLATRSLNSVRATRQRFIATSRPALLGAAAAIETHSGRDFKPDIRGFLKTEQNVVRIDVAKDGATKGAVTVDEFELSPTTKRALQKEGITELFPVQAACYEPFSSNKDVIVRARTGTGKTLAFALPIVEQLLSNPRGRGEKGPAALVMVPTRELAVQVASEFQRIAPQLRTEALYGGKAYASQQRALAQGIDVVVGTPGRLVDLMNRGDLSFATTRCVVLDEADRMLDIGFQEEMDTILEEIKEIRKEERAQVCLFSATLPTWIQKVTRKYMSSTNRISIDLIGDEEIKTAETVQHLRMRVNPKARARVIQDLIMMYGRTIIFVETKLDAEHLAQSLPDAAALHGDITQQGREAAFDKFKKGKLMALVATDVAARGLDVPDIQLVIQAEPPRHLESYIHRSGRTGRAGKTGTCITLYSNPDNIRQLEMIEKEIGLKMARAGAPQASVLVQATMSTTRHMLNHVSDHAASYYTEAAQSLAEEHGGVAALAKALALVGGAKSLTPRSLLDGTLERVTMMLRSDMAEFRAASMARRLIEPYSTSISDQMEALMVTSDGKGIVFDLPVKAAHDLRELWKHDIYALSTPDHLPPLREAQTAQGSFGRQNNGYGRGGRGGGRDSSSYGRGGRDNFSHGRGGRDNSGYGKQGRDRGSQRGSGSRRDDW